MDKIRLSFFFAIAFYIFNNNIFGVISLILLGVEYIFYLVKSPISMALPMGIFYVIFVVPRAVALCMGYLEPFNLFLIDDDDLYWVFSLVISAFMFLEFCKLADRYFPLSMVLLEKRSFNDLSIAKVGAVLFVFGVLLTGFYLKEIGGFYYLINNYNADFYSYVSAGNDSQLKNLAIYFLVAGYLILSTWLFVFNRFWMAVWWGVLILAALCSMVFIKREYLFEILIMGFISGYSRKVVKSKAILFFMGVIVFFVMIGMFVIRSLDGGDGIVNYFDIFDTAEFWMLDQYIQVQQKGDVIFGVDFGVIFLKSALAPFMSFSDYTSIDVILVENSTGISNWGIPAGILGYYMLVFGSEYFILPAIFLPAFFCAMQALIFKCALKFNNIFKFMPSLFLVYMWFICRNGDPISAVFYTNRVFFIVVFSVMACVFFVKKDVRDEQKSFGY